MRTFGAPDPLGTVNAFDLHLYVGGDPLNAVDPFGLELVDVDRDDNRNPGGQGNGEREERGPQNREFETWGRGWLEMPGNDEWLSIEADAEASIAANTSRLRDLPPRGATSPYMLAQSDVLAILQNIMHLSHMTEPPREVGTVIYQAGDRYFVSPTELSGVGTSDFRLGVPGESTSMFPFPRHDVPATPVLIVHTHPFVRLGSSYPSGGPHGDEGSDISLNSEQLPLALVWTLDESSVGGVTIYSRFWAGAEPSGIFQPFPAAGGLGEAGRLSFEAIVRGATDGASIGDRAAFSFWLNEIADAL